MRTRIFAVLSSMMILGLLVTLTGTTRLTPLVHGQPSGPTWTKKNVPLSPSDVGPGMAYDSNRNRTVFFGGDAETWEYDGTAWAKKTPTTSPPRRQLTTMAYDASRRRVVLFGGFNRSGDLNDTWEYDGITWVKRDLAASPAAHRAGAVMAYDSARSRLVLFGGGTLDGGLLNETWEYDGLNWVRKTPANSPPERGAAALAYDSARKRIVLFGGETADQTLNDTWEYDGSNWTKKAPSSSPTYSTGLAMTYDSGRSRVVLYGGGRGSGDETWEYDGANWVEVPVTASPPAAYFPGIVYDSSRQRVILLMGGETWEYGPSQSGSVPRLEITRVEFSPNPPSTFQQVDVKLTIENKGTAAYSPVWNYTGRLTLAGGSNTREIDFDDGHNSVLLLENPQDPFRVNQKWVLTIHATFWDAVNSGRMQITLQPKGLGGSTPSLPAVQTTQTVTVREDLIPFAKCSVAIAETFAGALGDTGECVLEAYASAGAAVQCKDRLCQAKAFGAGLAKCAVKPVSIVAGIKDTFDSKELEARAKDCYTPLQWVGDLVRDLIGRGMNINLFGIHSPATLLITDQAGRRTGMLDNGTVVQEIPDAWVVIDGEEKYVIYHGTGPVTVRVKGTGVGTMRVEMTTNDGKDGGRSVAYDAVPVNPNLVAQVVSTDGQATLSIDNNGDGRVDQSKKPDTIGPVTPVGRAFSETGRTVSGKYWTTWQGSRSFEDSLYINGLPLTERRPEVNPTDGKTYETQWFERARFEYHPENQPPNDVLLGLMGVRAAQGRQGEEPFKTIPNPGNGLDWFKETGHTLGDTTEGGQAIATFWRRLGGLAQFGFPLSQPFMEINKENGKQYLVQYFERQRFEYHPENKGTRYEVLLGRLGAEQSGVQITPPQSTPPPASLPGTITAENVNQLKLIRTLKQPAGVSSLAYAPDGRVLASGAGIVAKTGEDLDIVKLWNVANGSELRTLRGHRFSITSVVFSPDGLILATNSSDRTIRLWRTSDGMLLRVLEDPQASFGIAFSPDGKSIAASCGGAGGETYIRIWSVANGALLLTIPTDYYFVRNLAFSRDGQTLAGAGGENYIRFWSPLDGSPKGRIEGRPTGRERVWKSKEHIAFAPDGGALAAGDMVTNDEDNDQRAEVVASNITMYEGVDGTVLWEQEAHTQTMTEMVFAPNGSLITSTSLDNTLKFWNSSTGQLVHTISGHQPPYNETCRCPGIAGIHAAAFAPDGKTLAVGHRDGSIEIWGLP